MLFACWNINLDEVLLEQLDHYIAVENYLTEDDELPPNATNLEQISGYQEAFHHLCEVAAWEKASEILFTNLNTSTNEELHEQLSTWGYYREQTHLYNRLLDKLSPSKKRSHFSRWLLVEAHF